MSQSHIYDIVRLKRNIIHLSASYRFKDVLSIQRFRYYFKGSDHFCMAMNYENF